MPDAAFAELVQGLTTAFGQQMGASRQADEGLFLRTTDDFVYVFVEDPTRLSLAAVQRWIAEAPGGGRHLLVLSRTHLPLALTAELAHSLGLGAYLGQEPRPARPGGPDRRLPSAHLLDELMARGRTWLEWGVPALALRFFRQATDLKPEYGPGRIGAANALLALGLVEDARRAFREVLSTDPESLDARIGTAAVLGAEGHPDAEIHAYRTLLHEDPTRLSVRAHLIAALLEHHHWEAARAEIALMLETVPEDARLRFLHAIALERSGDARAAAAERDRARALGLPGPLEDQLSRQLGVEAPERPEPVSPIPASVAAPPPPEPPAPAPASAAPGRPARDSARGGAPRPKKLSAKGKRARGKGK
jgi:tetratricopeptide (TPR) repeat protein